MFPVVIVSIIIRPTAYGFMAEKYKGYYNKYLQTKHQIYSNVTVLCFDNKNLYYSHPYIIEAGAPIVVLRSLPTFLFDVDQSFEDATRYLCLKEYYHRVSERMLVKHDPLIVDSFLLLKYEN